MARGKRSKRRAQAPGNEQSRRPEEAPAASTEAPAAAAEPSGAPAEPTASSGASRGKIAVLGAALVILVALVIGAAALGGGDDSDGLQFADGVIVHHDDERLVLRPTEPLDDEEQVEMTILPEDRERVDVEHLQYHAIQGDIFRIFYEKDGDQYLARNAEDIPGGEH